MALASQTSRPPAGRTSDQFTRAGGPPGKGGGRTAVALLLVAIAAVAVVWGLTKLGGGGMPATTPTTPPDHKAAGGGNDAAPVTQAPGKTPVPLNSNAGTSDANTNHAVAQNPANETGEPGADGQTDGSSPSGVNAPGTPDGAGANGTVTPAPAPAPEIDPLKVTDLPTQVNDWLTQAEQAQSQGKLVEARSMLNSALLDARISETDRDAFRALISEINQTLVFSPAISENDPLVGAYAVQSGDNLTKIGIKAGAVTSWRFIARVNRLSDPNRLKLGQRLKVVKGPFHVVIDKSAYRMDVYAGSAPGGAGNPNGPESDWIYIRSFPVGLGADNMTPLAVFRVKQGSKLINPHWANPRTGEKFDADDPKNPIGERWIGLEGADDASRQYVGYGIHGTIDPSSVGKQMSMGCVRLNSADVEVVWEMLQEQVSCVKIVP